MTSLLNVFYILNILTLISCKPNTSYSQEKLISVNKKETRPLEDQFNKYWYTGKAELNSYDLKQSRYNEIREGEVVLVFVTEPFSISKQVKLDNPKASGEDNVSVMKLNQIRKFTTGIYDYSIINSSFTPVDLKRHPNTLKLTTSIQEWCGHTFTQLNLKKGKYKFQQLSYFEADGDTHKDIPLALLEDELMSRIRLNEGQLPLGKVDMIFSAMYSRFSYEKMEATKAQITKNETSNIISYNIEYLGYKRKLSIDVEKEFPYRILSWKENDGDGLITEAKLKKTINEPYWNQKKLNDEQKRIELELIK